MIAEGYKRGYDIPDKLKDHIRTSPHAQGLELENKMPEREKAKRRAKAEKEADADFFEKTGIRNKAEDYNLANAMAIYNYDMHIIKREEEKKQGKNKKKFDRNNVDPQTGKRIEKWDDDQPISDDENAFDDIMKEDPEF